MKIAVIVFPGSNCDVDLYEALRTVCDADVEYVSHHDSSLDGFDMVIIYVPGQLPGSPTSCRQLSRWPMKANQYLELAMDSRF